MAIGLEKINWNHRRILFSVITIISGAYLLGFTNDLFEGILTPIFNFELGFEFINGRNILGLGLFYLAFAIYNRQVA